MCDKMLLVKARWKYGVTYFTEKSQKIWYEVYKAMQTDELTSKW